MVSPQSIKEYVEKIKGKAPVFVDWPKNLWNKEHDDIVHFIINRFEHTLNEVEYYYCIPFMTKADYPFDLLFVPYRDSPQYQELYSKGTHTKGNETYGVLTHIKPIEVLGQT